jgi:hypothetical protein
MAAQMIIIRKGKTTSGVKTFSFQPVFPINVRTLWSSAQDMMIEIARDKVEIIETMKLTPENNIADKTDPPNII